MAIAKPSKTISAPSSRVFPTDEDMALWNSLTPAEQFLVLEREEDTGFQSGIASREALQDRLARVRSR